MIAVIICDVAAVGVDGGFSQEPEMSQMSQDLGMGGLSQASAFSLSIMDNEAASLSQVHFMSNQ